MLQTSKMTREFRPFLISPLAAKSTFLHHSSMNWSEGCGTSDATPKCDRRENQKTLENTQPTRR
jgi:hypothetical protein